MPSSSVRTVLRDFRPGSLIRSVPCPNRKARALQKVWKETKPFRKKIKEKNNAAPFLQQWKTHEIEEKLFSLKRSREFTRIAAREWRRACLRIAARIMSIEAEKMSQPMRHEDGSKSFLHHFCNITAIVRADREHILQSHMNRQPNRLFWWVRHESLQSLMLLWDGFLTPLYWHWYDFIASRQNWQKTISLQSQFNVICRKSNQEEGATICIIFVVSFTHSNERFWNIVRESTIELAFHWNCFRPIQLTNYEIVSIWADRGPKSVSWEHQTHKNFVS